VLWKTPGIAQHFFKKMLLSLIHKLLCEVSII